MIFIANLSIKGPILAHISVINAKLSFTIKNVMLNHHFLVYRNAKCRTNILHSCHLYVIKCESIVISNEFYNTLLIRASAVQDEF